MRINERFGQHRLDHAVRTPESACVLPERRTLFALMSHRRQDLIMGNQIWVFCPTLADVRTLHAVEPSAHAAFRQPMLVFNRDAAPSLCRSAESAMRIELRCRISDDQHLKLAATLGEVGTRFKCCFRRIRCFVDDDHHPLCVNTLNVGHSLRSVAFGDCDS